MVALEEAADSTTHVLAVTMAGESVLEEEVELMGLVMPTIASKTYGYQSIMDEFTVERRERFRGRRGQK